MKGPLRFVIFAVVCAYAHAQCCVGTFTTEDMYGEDPDPVQAKDETACIAAKDILGSGGSWISNCTAGTSCMIMKCTGKQGNTTFKSVASMCSTAAIQTDLVTMLQEAPTAVGATEVKCASSGVLPKPVIFDAPTIPATECYFGWCAQAEAAVVLETRGSCEWSVGFDRSLLYYKNCFAPTRPGKLLARSGACADDSGTSLRFSGPAVGVSYGIAAIADGALSGLPRLESLDLSNNPIAGLAPSVFAGNTALKSIDTRDTALGCVPAGGIPVNASTSGVPRCPEACAPGTVYNASAAACVTCPTGLQPLAPGTVGGVLGMCVPAGWDAIFLSVCGSCAFWRTKTGSVLVRTGSCADDCRIGLAGGWGTGGALDLSEREIRGISDGALSGLPLLKSLFLLYNPIAGLAPSVFAGNNALESIVIGGTSLGGTAVGCVPVGGIPATVSIYGVPRCPEACAPGTVYNVSATACVACPAGLQPLAPGGTVGGSLGTCVPAGWDATATLLDVCGGCAFWITAGSVLVRTGNCADNCPGGQFAPGQLFLSACYGDRFARKCGSRCCALDRDRDIAAVAPGFFEGLTGLRYLFIKGNSVGCVPGVASNVEIDCCPASIEGPPTNEPVCKRGCAETPRCPSNCTVGTFYGSAGACLPCPKGLTTTGVGAAGAKSCVDPTTLSSASSSVTIMPVPTVATPAAPYSTPMNIAPSVSKYFVAFTVTLPYTKSEFDTDKQQKFKTAVSSAAGVPDVNVAIADIIEKRRRAGSIDVFTKIRGTDETGINAMLSTLGSGDAFKTKININLKTQGLKESTSVTTPTKANLSSDASMPSLTWALVLVAASGVMVF